MTIKAKVPIPYKGMGTLFLTDTHGKGLSAWYLSPFSLSP